MPQHDVQHATTFLTDQVYSFSLVDDKRGEKSISLDLDNYSGEQLEVFRKREERVGQEHRAESTSIKHKPRFTRTA